MSAIVIIPSRYASTRFPGKPLCPLSGKPIIQHVYERANEARLVQDVFVATDNKLIYDAVEGFGGKAIMTSEAHQSGTDRIAEAVEKLQVSSVKCLPSNAFIGGQVSKYKIQDADIIVNVQGDEPLIHPKMVDDVIKLMDDERASIGTLAKRIEEEKEITDPNIVKVVFNDEGFALYFSRSPIPYHRDAWTTTPPNPPLIKGGNFRNPPLDKGGHGGVNSELQTPNFYFKHIGIYAYRKDVLLKFSKMSPTRLEQTEKLEQLRALENGLKIKVKETEFETIGVDTPMDLERVEKCLSISL